MEKMTVEEKVRIAAGEENWQSVHDSAKQNALIAAVAPRPCPTPNITREMMIPHGDVAAKNKGVPNG